MALNTLLGAADSSDIRAWMNQHVAATYQKVGEVIVRFDFVETNGIRLHSVNHGGGGPTKVVSAMRSFILEES
jgi:hypothetical protein